MSAMPSLDLVFAALSDPTRRAILERLAKGETSVTTLTESFAISQPAISRHLKVLERAGLISRGRDAQFRPCRLNASPLQRVATWALGYQKFWDQSFDRLDAYVRTLTPAQASPLSDSTQSPSKPKNRKNRKVSHAKPTQ